MLHITNPQSCQPPETLSGRAERRASVLFKNSFFQTESILKRFEEEHIFPNILLQTEQLSTVRKFVARNLAVGFMFSRISETVRDIVSIPLDPPMPVR